MNAELNIKGTEDSPTILFNKTKGSLSISGRSLPEDAFNFYEPIFEWLKNYFSSSAAETIFTFNLEYFNTSSAKQIFKIINYLSEHSKKNKVSVIWQYDSGDKDMLSSGERFSKLTGLPIKLIQN